MSIRLKMLETQIGGLLFVRQHHRLEPTSKGSELYAKALSVLAAYDEMLSATRSETVRQKVRIGVPDDYALSICARVMTTMRDDIKDMEIELVCDLSANLVAALQRQDVDLALVTLASRPSSARISTEARLNWVYAPDLHIQTVALAAYPEGCVFRRAMITALEGGRRQWRVAIQSQSHAGIVAAVNAGIAVTSMAEGTAPHGLIESGTTKHLPALEPVPIYLMSQGATATAAARRVEDKIISELEAIFL
jgi:DNA-binding transcriptional LysR family regulator